MLQESLSLSFHGPLLATNILAKRIQSELARDIAFKENGLTEIILGHSLNRWDYHALVDLCLAVGGARCTDVSSPQKGYPGISHTAAPLEMSPRRKAPVHFIFQPLPQ